MYGTNGISKTPAGIETNDLTTGVTRPTRTPRLPQRSNQRSARLSRDGVTWNGRTGAGALAYAGSYRVHVSATNSLGTVDLYAPFAARR